MTFEVKVQSQGDVLRAHRVKEIPDRSHSTFKDTEVKVWAVHWGGQMAGMLGLSQTEGLYIMAKCLDFIL